MSGRIKIVCIFFVLAFSACREEITPNPPTFYQIITGKNKKTWKITGLKWTGVGKTDYTYSLSSCYKDDLYVFYANTERLYEVTGGTNKCSTDEAATLVSDSWTFVSPTATLTIIMPLFSDNALPFYVESVTSTSMTLQIYIDQDSQYSYVVTMQSVSEE